MGLMQRWARRWRRPPELPDALWSAVLADLPFVAGRNPTELNRLRDLCGHFLAEKEFHGAHGLNVTDTMALSIAVQACLRKYGLGKADVVMRNMGQAEIISAITPTGVRPASFKRSTVASV